ncbi:MAG: hypothetical protein MUP36_02930 [Demequinaceae bacterium]|nr:hypothetical protein [Demequinaceae bacterium]
MPPTPEVPNLDADTVRRVIRWFEGNGRTLPWREARLVSAEQGTYGL